MNSDQDATTEYGSWDSTVDPQALNAQGSAVEMLAGYASDYNTAELGRAYVDAINAALPVRVSLAGEQFYGPWIVKDGEWDGYPTTEGGRLDIKAIVEGVDFWRLARSYEYGATLYVTVEAGAENKPGRFFWQLVTDIERVDQEADEAMTAHDLAEVTANNQTAATGDLWRVRVWAGPDEFEARATPLAEHVHDTRDQEQEQEEATAQNISHTETYAGYVADLALPGDLETALRDALADHDDRTEIAGAINEAVTAKLREHGVNTDTGEWLGDWSAEQIVREILARHGAAQPAV